MGMFSGVLEGAGRGLEEFGSKLLGKTVASPKLTTAWSLAGVKEDVFKAFPEGKPVGDLMQAYWPVKDKTLGQLDAPLKSLYEGIQGRTDYMTQRLAEKPLAQIHDTLRKNNDPLSLHSQKLLDSRQTEDGQSLNGNKTLQQMSYSNELQASNIARAQVFGKNMSNMAPWIMSLKQSEDPVKNSYADLLMSVVSNNTHDLTADVHGAPASDVKLQIRAYIEQENKANELLAKAEGKEYKEVPLPKTNSTYSSQSDLERAVRSFTIIRQAPFAAVSHALMPVNLVMSSPLKAVIQGLITMKTPELKQLNEAASILFQTNHSILDAAISAGTGFVQHKTGNNRVAEFIYNTMHMPGLNWIRRQQLHLSGAVGYHSAIMWGEAALKGDKRAIEELKGLGLDPFKIIAQGGKLNDAELKQAVYHFTDDRMFINRNKFNSLTANSNPFMRSATTFHGFINAQSAFMQRQLLLMLKAGDYKGIAQFAGTLGVAYPIVAPLIKSLGVLGRTASPDKALKSALDDYKHLSQPENIEEFARTYIEMLSYVGGLGMAHQFIQGAWNDRLALVVMGPTIGAGVRTAQDVITGVTKSNRSGKHNLKPLGRDILDNSVPIFGKELEHQLIPPTRR